METVNIAVLKARLSHYLRAVRGGAIIDVLDRSSPIARIVPLADETGALPSRAPRRSLGSLSFPPPARGVSSLEALREERQSNR